MRHFPLSTRQCLQACWCLHSSAFCWFCFPTKRPGKLHHRRDVLLCADHLFIYPLLRVLPLCSTLGPRVKVCVCVPALPFRGPVGRCVNSFIRWVTSYIGGKCRGLWESCKVSLEEMVFEGRRVSQENMGEMSLLWSSPEILAKGLGRSNLKEKSTWNWRTVLSSISLKYSLLRYPLNHIVGAF